jgi:hypothetical protein
VVAPRPIVVHVSTYSYYLVLSGNTHTTSTSDLPECQSRHFQSLKQHHCETNCTPTRRSSFRLSVLDRSLSLDRIALQASLSPAAAAAVAGAAQGVSYELRHEPSTPDGTRCAGKERFPYGQYRPCCTLGSPCGVRPEAELQPDRLCIKW